MFRPISPHILLFTCDLMMAWWYRPKHVVTLSP